MFTYKCKLRLFTADVFRENLDKQFTCGTVIKWRHGGDFQKTVTEDIPL